VEEAAAYTYVRGKDLTLDHADGVYIIAFGGMLLGYVEINNKKASNKLPRPFHILP
jgi:NOL1/NOP2/fmu family ribosome biogenesis protein